MTDDLLARIAAALERLAPPPAPSADLSGNSFVWADRRLTPVTAARAQPLDVFAGVDAQRDALLQNTRRHAAALPAHDVLLWGARGMGKSSLVKSVAAAVRAAGHDLMLVQVGRDDIGTLGTLFDAMPPRRALVFADDLSFEADETQYKALRSVLDGGIAARPDGVRLVVTSNRRHLVPRAHADGDAINPRDVLDDRLALADRFGLSLGFHNADQDTYLAIVARYAAAHELAFDESAALAWATGRGNRSGRVAWQYIEEIAGSAGRRLD
ncbi:ATP-binding protein [Glacieibacterium frigidum]|uniref:ATP-binding protein n=1 Tax=Glacieibacterium frigidum TaxID=2593303 RepID=A0A552UGW0_9SPHN|nr:ATP-binding protein [Glacieibacterium frigidum]TRW17455.1 ATP-binding protein [Glacieibacterium frigidum]